MWKEHLMKKQILTLTMCLALTATSALANGTATVAKKSPVKPAVTKSAPAKVAVKKVAPIKAVAVVKPAQTPEVTLTPEQAAKKKFEEKMAADREHLYTDLGLTPEQRAKAAALDAKVKSEAEPLIKKVHEEKAKLKDLKAKSASEADILKQKAEVKKAKKAAKAHFQASRKEFEAILTPEQKAKFKEIREARKAEMKKHENCKCPCHKQKGPKGHGCGPMGPEPKGPDFGPVPPMGPEPKCPCKK